MSSCGRCGSCTKYFETPSGNCDYCDCPYEDHTPGGRVQPSMRDMPNLGFNPTQPSFQQPQMGYQHQQGMGVHQNMQPFPMQSSFPVQSQFQQPMYSLPSMQQPFMPPNMNPFCPQPNSFQPYTGMPMNPPNQQPAYVGNKSCTMCGVILPPGPTNKGQLCMTCMQNKPPSLCTKCKSGKANPGFSWCQACFETDDTCRKCGKNDPNEGYKWCEACYLAQENPVDCIIPEVVPIPANKACLCGRPKFYNIKEKKLFDFCGQTCAQQHFTAYGVLKLDNKHEDFVSVSAEFQKQWNQHKGGCPAVTAIFKVRPDGVEGKFNEYLQSLREKAKTIEYYFHGCKITCDLLNTKTLCNRTDCTICLVSRQGFDISKVGTNVSFTRFGRGLYFAPESSKCHDYTLGVDSYGYRAMFYVKCAPGFKQLEFKDNPNRTAPDSKYNSLYGHAGGSLNYDELCLYTDKACVPEYIIIYAKDGVIKRCF
ncbi:hypothetical protein LOD99_5146 [Oopsacas minuta]|uniref:PARP n=1 Tax=Oopsacas minuta TaxID=111878 RepID=A0AAV7JRC3_9METZ|nr:hypothetical protein LOD99_5146 [Oopsacas minuta]